ncbi:hypothetical protein [Microbacterium caowuchunii]|uniref:Uncharacterized protein n=1 Tax=Microbacterium caowuchunii TaxID=2614638 RepID=A0A5N0TGZ5_9MICO|nr:hypothetical protein [Microbacterium caowuchunii]KAA9133718.1 hypothetical protein F6B40_08165 [Microbacterium caowuchunii]
MCLGGHPDIATLASLKRTQANALLDRWMTSKYRTRSEADYVLRFLRGRLAERGSASDNAVAMASLVAGIGAIAIATVVGWITVLSSAEADAVRSIQNLAWLGGVAVLGILIFLIAALRPGFHARKDAARIREVEAAIFIDQRERHILSSRRNIAALARSRAADQLLS